MSLAEYGKPISNVAELALVNRLTRELWKAALMQEMPRCFAQAI